MVEERVARFRLRKENMANGLIIRSSAIHAAGCYTTRKVRKGQRVCEYDGPRLSKKEADKLYADRFVTYLFGVGKRSVVIDGFGTAMFINHCCEPNCESEERDGRIFIIALRDIAAGEELTYEYNLYDSDDQSQDCFCGRPSCRGTMFAPAEVKRRLRLERASARRAGKPTHASTVDGPSESAAGPPLQSI